MDNNYNLLLERLLIDISSKVKQVQNAEHPLRWWLLPKREILTGFVTIGDLSEKNGDLLRLS